MQKKTMYKRKYRQGIEKNKSLILNNCEVQKILETDASTA